MALTQQEAAAVQQISDTLDTVSTHVDQVVTTLQQQIPALQQQLAQVQARADALQVEDDELTDQLAAARATAASMEQDVLGGLGTIQQRVGTLDTHVQALGTTPA